MPRLAFLGEFDSQCDMKRMLFDHVQPPLLTSNKSQAASSS